MDKGNHGDLDNTWIISLTNGYSDGWEGEAHFIAMQW